MRKQYILKSTIDEPGVKIAMYAEEDKVVIEKAAEMMMSLINTEILKDWTDRPMVTFTVTEGERQILRFEF